MISTYQIDAIDGDHLVPHNSAAMNRTISIGFHETPTAGTVEIKARPFGRSEFLPIEGSPAFSAEAENTIICAYPIAELMLTLSGVAGGTLIYVTVADGEQ